MPTAAPLSTTPDPIRDLGVAWMNRGHEFMRRGDAAGLTAALDAYSEAVVTLRRLPVGENPASTNSLAAALMNKGQLLHRLHGVAQAAVALESYDEALALLHPLTGPAPESAFSPSPSPWPRRNLAGTLLNRANLLLDLARFADAGTDAQMALALAKPTEHTEVIDADLALKARRAACDALGRLLVAPAAVQGDLAAETSDLVDDALALIRHWQARQPAVFSELAARFFRFGTQLYRQHQPHFLAEFIRENLPAHDPELRVLALAAINSALADKSHQPEFLTLGDPVSERHVQASRDLASLRSSLAA